MNNLLVGTLDGAAANAIPKAHVFVVLHSAFVGLVVADERRESLFGLRGTAFEAMQAVENLKHVAFTKVGHDSAYERIGSLRALTEMKTSEFPGLLDGMPKIENLTTLRKHCRTVPNPFGAVADDDDYGVCPEPAKLMQFAPESVEDLVCVAQCGDKRAANQTVATGCGLNPLCRQQ